MENNLKKFREAMGLRQQDVALKVGLTRAAYSHYEKGIREPKLEVLIRIADLFHTSIDELLGHECNRDSLKAWELDFLTKVNKLDSSSRDYLLISLSQDALRKHGQLPFSSNIDIR